jgi:hypothetical protein
LAAQFRPDGRPDASGQKGGGPLRDENGDLHAQFRPIKPRVRRTYEQLYQRPEPVVQYPPAAPMLPYPAMPYLPPAPIMPYWPGW